MRSRTGEKQVSPLRVSERTKRSGRDDKGWEGAKECPGLKPPCFFGGFFSGLKAAANPEVQKQKQKQSKSKQKQDQDQDQKQIQGSLRYASQKREAPVEMTELWWQGRNTGILRLRAARSAQDDACKKSATRLRLRTCRWMDVRVGRRERPSGCKARACRAFQIAGWPSLRVGLARCGRGRRRPCGRRRW